MTEYIQEQDASTYLGVTVRTLRNYRRKGKLAFREVKGKTRSLIEYERPELERIKVELIARQACSRKQEPRTASLPRVTFGLPKQEFEELCRDADRLGQSVGEYARRLVRERLESEYEAQAAELLGKLKRTEADIILMRTEFAAGFEAVLEFVGVPRDEAKKWVRENLR